MTKIKTHLQLQLKLKISNLETPKPLTIQATKAQRDSFKHSEQHLPSWKPEQNHV
jgi:hypothetical protein